VKNSQNLSKSVKIDVKLAVLWEIALDGRVDGMLTSDLRQIVKMEAASLY